MDTKETWVHEEEACSDWLAAERDCGYCEEGASEEKVRLMHTTISMEAYERAYQRR